MTTLTPDLAQRFASLALSHIQREYPNKLDHVMNGAADVRSPRELHPIFYGSFDWHSCVHGYWLLARVLRYFPSLTECTRIRALFNGAFTDANVAAELAYLQQPNRGTFERPYGWAWLLMLAGELAQLDGTDGTRWSETLSPLTREFVARFHAFLLKATYPIRAGTHFNTAFALVLAFDYARVCNDAALAHVLRDKAVAWYAHDADCQAWEPGGDDFLSPALIETACMRSALDADAFAAWLSRFLPRLDQRAPATLFVPAVVSDRTDGKIGHLDGLNLSRAWCWRSLASTLAATDPRRARALEAAELHLAASLPHVAGDYAGEHWLATFAMLAGTAIDN